MNPTTPESLGWAPKNGVKPLFPGADNLGEGPVWHPEFQKFFWIDIYGSKMSSLDPKTQVREDYKDFSLLKNPEENLTTLAPMKGGFIASLMWGGFCTISFPELEITQLSKEYPSSMVTEAKIRFNDGKCDPMGRMVGGTMNMEWSTDNSHIFILDTKDSEPRILVENVAITNGPTWSLDGKTFYYVDSMNPPVYACDYDLETGTLSNKRALAHKTELTTFAFDGATIDTQGFLWWAIFGGSKIVRINSETGEIERYIDLGPLGMKNPTSVAFGGEDYRTMFVTTESYHPSGGADLRGVGNNGGCCLITFDESEGIQGTAPHFWNGN